MNKTKNDEYNKGRLDVNEHLYDYVLMLMLPEYDYVWNNIFKDKSIDYVQGVMDVLKSNLVERKK